jgi:Tol biopolymer transport system component
MTKKNIIDAALIASLVFAAIIAGCIPEDSLQWNADGSRGIYSKKGALYLVDGGTGALVKIADKETTALWPAISPDGSQIAYSQIIKVGDFDKAFDVLPPEQAKEIKEHAEILKQKVLSEGIKDANLPVLEAFSNEQHTAWVDRLLVEKADSQLAQKLGPELINKAKSKELQLYQLIIAPTSDPNSKKIIMTSSRQLWRQKFSPDSKILAWLIDNVRGKSFEAGFDLYIGNLAQNTSPAIIAPAIACNYDFRPDSRAIAFLSPESENLKDQKLALGSLIEFALVNPDGKFLTYAKKESHTKEYAGVIYNCWMSVAYARDSRIFFSSTKMNLPSSKIDTEKGSVFCSDTLTGTVSDILPQIALDFTQGNYYLFQLSQDGRKMLLPGNKNTLGLYALGPDIEASKILVDANEGFGDDSPKLVSQWKGANQISCLISEKSRFLTADPNTPHNRKEIVILDTEGKLVKVLSKNWPDELLEF